MKIGVDLIETARLVRLMALVPTLEDRLYSPRERQQAAALASSRRAEFFSGRFAAKEAVLKALRLGLGEGDLMPQVEILRRSDGSPRLILKNKVAKVAERLGVIGDVSISHEAGLACAVACFFRPGVSE
jgi:holo-[acyl-carrier protein] synthase